MKLAFVISPWDGGLDWRLLDYADDVTIPVQAKWHEVYDKVGGQIDRPSPETNLRVLAWWCKNMNE